MKKGGVEFPATAKCCGSKLGGMSMATNRKGKYIA